MNEYLIACIVEGTAEAVIIEKLLDEDCLIFSWEDLIHEDKSLQTQQQAVEVVKMAMDRGWKRLALVASHEHQYRAYLTFLRQVLDTKSGIILYNAPVRNLEWFVDSGWGMRFDRLKAEIERIEKYSEFGHLANAQEVVEYQKWKERQ